MQVILIVATLLGLLMPTFAFAELNYNAFDAGASTTSYTLGGPLTGIYADISNSISEHVYIKASLGSASQTEYVSSPGFLSESNIRKVKSLSFGGGYHTPLNHTPLQNDVDAIAEGQITLVSDKSQSGNNNLKGYNIGGGVRAHLFSAIEGAVIVTRSSMSAGSISNTDTYLSVRFGFSFIPEFQMTTGADFKHDLTTRIGVRYYY
jgi:hypothetical protein